MMACPTGRELLSETGPKVVIDPSRDDELTSFGKATLKDRYLLPGETCQDMFVRVATAYADDLDHAQRLYDYMSKLWFMPATPILSNGGTKRGLPISCFLSSVGDDLQAIADSWMENIWLAAKGGGLGTYWGNVRSIGEKVGNAGHTSGIVPFIHVQDSLTLAIAQGSLRRGSAAVYLDIWHPEIEEFLEIRKPSGDFNRKCLNLHHGICITDEFMEAVYDDKLFALRSPKTKEVIRMVNARELWQRVLETRLQTGEPYLLFIDQVNRHLPEHQKRAGMRVSSSNLCSEIVEVVGTDYLNKERTAVCCLSSLNLETWDEWANHPIFVKDLMRFLDNVLQGFIESAPPSMENAVYSAMMERSVGLGVMGFHSFLQSKGIPFESSVAKIWNHKMFSKIKKEADLASRELAEERGACPDAALFGIQERFTHKIAIAPTASISIICGSASPSIEPWPANLYTHKTLSGNFTVRNKHLGKLLDIKNQNTNEVWSSIAEHEGSVQHLDFLEQKEKDVFKTAFELDQLSIVDLAADRVPFICQSQSVNVFLPANIDKWDLHLLHWLAWKKGLKSLYYCRSKVTHRAASTLIAKENFDQEVCESCQ